MASGGTGWTTGDWWVTGWTQGVQGDFLSPAAGRSMEEQIHDFCAPGKKKHIGSLYSQYGTPRGAGLGMRVLHWARQINLLKINYLYHGNLSPTHINQLEYTIDNIMTLYHLRSASGSPLDCTQCMCYTGQLNSI